MAKNYDNYGYDNEYDYTTASLVRRILIVIMVIVAIMLFILLIQGCSRKKKDKKVTPVTSDLSSLLVEAGKSYFDMHNEEAPSAPGECSIVELQTLLNEKLIDETKASGCNTTNTYVKMCILENKTKHYAPWLICVDENSDNEYSSLKEGTSADIIADSTYIEFKYLPQVVKGEGEILGPVEELWQNDIKYESYKTLETTKYYRYRDKLFIWDLITRNYYTSSGEKNNSSEVSEYYPSAPTSYHTSSSDKTNDAYKWYKSNSTKEYYTVNGEKALSKEAVGNYTIKDPYGVDVTRYRTRTVTSTYSPIKYYLCSTSSSSPYIIYQKEKCGLGERSAFNVQRGAPVYSCAKNTADIVNNHVSSSYQCKNYSSWSSFTEKKCDTSKTDLCEAYTITYYYWYRNVGNSRTYYPSGASSASGEKVYFTSEPFKGAIKDTSTRSTAYKWYNEKKATGTSYLAVKPKEYPYATKTNTYKWSDWSSWSTNNPKVNDGRERIIEEKNKIKLQEIQGISNAAWENLNDNYLSENELIEIFKSKGYKVETLSDIINNGEIRYILKLYVRNKKEGK